MMLSTFLEKVIKWAEDLKEVSALILLGSRAGPVKTDDLADYDMTIISDDIEYFLKNDKFLFAFGNPLICIHEKIVCPHATIPTRLTIFDNGIKADFSFISPKDVTSGHMEPILHNYKVLIDKIGCCKKIKKPHFSLKPSSSEYFSIIEEFLFEAYHVAKYLKRNDLFSAKFRMNGIIFGPLLKMIEWHHMSNSEWTNSIPPHGKKMAEWADEKIYQEIIMVFSPLEVDKIKKSFSKALDLFFHLAQDVGKKLNTNYPFDLFDQMMNIFQKL